MGMYLNYKKKYIDCAYYQRYERLPAAFVEPPDFGLLQCSSGSPEVGQVIESERVTVHVKLHVPDRLNATLRKTEESCEVFLSKKRVLNVVTHGSKESQTRAWRTDVVTWRLLAPECSVARPCESDPHRAVQ